VPLHRALSSGALALLGNIESGRTATVSVDGAEHVRLVIAERPSADLDADYQPFVMAGVISRSDICQSAPCR
jgi:hypothetical protein